MADIAKTLDASGLACPMPVVKTRMAITDLQSGDVLEVISTDRGSCTDIPAWTEGTGNKLIEQREENGSFVFLIEKS
ncbi:Rhodanese-like domain protein [Euzebya pacifica]|jgi:tRNA 2-thiouridine synthesizing protein A|uniref:Rhodanese-like domain protein n=1 Tax=Euzebya pacifica TaxID=1608957 RepID=A0A346XRC8_9ACTN|nr:sulfurtransferase TusA family protein [Euzebya pacifica]AXV04775.1 Rhodanese-like domain protein [Euzebya pacifica]